MGRDALCLHAGVSQHPPLESAVASNRESVLGLFTLDGPFHPHFLSFTGRENNSIWLKSQKKMLRKDDWATLGLNLTRSNILVGGGRECAALAFLQPHLSYLIGKKKCYKSNY